MLAGTSVKPPQLDEFFLAGEQNLRATNCWRWGSSPPDASAFFLCRCGHRSERPRSLDCLPPFVAADARVPPRLGEPGPGAVVARLRSLRDAPGQGRNLLRARRAVAGGVGREPGSGRAGSRRDARRGGGDAAGTARSSTISRRATTRSPSAIPTACRSKSRIAGRICPRCRDAELVKVPGHGVTLGGYLFKPVRPASRPIRRVILLHGFAGHAFQLAGLARLTAANGYAVLALSLRGWLGSEGENDQGLRQPLDILAAIDWLAKPAAGRPRPHRAGRRVDGRTGGACWPPPTSRRYAPWPRSSRPPTWRVGARPIPTCATISTISAVPRACRCAHRSCGWRRSMRRSC
jgi:hypothetical protein